MPRYIKSPNPLFSFLYMFVKWLYFHKQDSIHLLQRESDNDADQRGCSGGSVLREERVAKCQGVVDPLLRRPTTPNWPAQTGRRRIQRYRRRPACVPKPQNYKMELEPEEGIHSHIAIQLNLIGQSQSHGSKSGKTSCTLLKLIY